MRAQHLPFVLPDFYRQSWVSEHARLVWEPRIEQIKRAWLHIEWLSVASGIRECGLIWVPHVLLPALIQQWTEASLSAIRLEAPSWGPGHTDTAGLVCVAVGDLIKLRHLQHAWAASDHDVIGQLLGYPSCCRAFFRNVWVERRHTDTTWEMAEHTLSRPCDNVAKISLPDEVSPYANILWRWLGVRAVPHLPCRFDCKPSIELGERLLQLGHSIGYTGEVEVIPEILAWPVEWSALHGIAEVKSPILKVSTRTDATVEKLVVQWMGKRYPKEGAAGINFPYQTARRAKLTQSRGFLQGLAHVEAASGSDWRHTDNGFQSAEAMDLLHKPILQLARAALEKNAGGNVLDLGCGNGILLEKICEGYLEVVPYGVDCSAVAIEHARQLQPRFSANFKEGDLFDCELWGGQTRYALALLMLGRLREVPRVKAKHLLDCLRISCTRVLVYVYSDWSEDALENLAQELGVSLQGASNGMAGYLDLWQSPHEAGSTQSPTG